MARYDNILETIGHTPLVKLQRLAPPGVTVYVKVEAFNPLASVIVATGICTRQTLMADRSITV